MPKRSGAHRRRQGHNRRLSEGNHKYAAFCRSWPCSPRRSCSCHLAKCLQGQTLGLATGMFWSSCLRAIMLIVFFLPGDLNDLYLSLVTAGRRKLTRKVSWTSLTASTFAILKRFQAGCCFFHRWQLNIKPIPVICLSQAKWTCLGDMWGQLSSSWGLGKTTCQWIAYCDLMGAFQISIIVVIESCV